MADWNGEIASREEMRERKRRAALHVASRLFNEKGYHATSLDEIADRIGVTKTALYYYFRNKEELLFECIEISLKAGETARTAAEASGLRSYDRFKSFYLDFLKRIMDCGGSYSTLINMRALPGPMQETLFKRRDGLRAYIQQLLEGALADGDIRAVDPEAISLFLIAALNWIMAYNQERAADALDHDEVASRFLDQILFGLETR